MPRIAPPYSHHNGDEDDLLNEGVDILHDTAPDPEAISDWIGRCYRSPEPHLCELVRAVSALCEWVGPSSKKEITERAAGAM